MIIDQSKAKSLVAAFNFHKPVGTLISVSSMAAFSDSSLQESRRILMCGVMDGSLKLVKASGGNIICETISSDERECNALMLSASAINEANRILAEAEKH